jgi:hypothetical protein
LPEELVEGERRLSMHCRSDVVVQIERDADLRKVGIVTTSRAGERSRWRYSIKVGVRDS